MKEMLSATWDSIHEWLDSHPSESDRQQAAMHQGQFLTTALHMVCKLNDPPVEIVKSLIDCAEETVTWPDSNGWLPLHHACANGASGKVLSVLVEAYPEGKVQQDKRFRTPLHFAFFRRDAHDDKMGKNSSITDPTKGGLSGGMGGEDGGNKDGDGDDVVNSMPEIVRLLADSGAAELQDEGGMVSLLLDCIVRIETISTLITSFSLRHSCQCTMPVPTVPHVKSSRSSSKTIPNQSPNAKIKDVIPSILPW